MSQSGYSVIQYDLLRDAPTKVAITTDLLSFLATWMTSGISRKILLSFGLSLLIARFGWNWFQRYKQIRRLQHKKTLLNTRLRILEDYLFKTCPSVESLLVLTRFELERLQKKLRIGEIQPVDILHAYQLQSLVIYGDGNSGVCELVRQAEEQMLQLPEIVNLIHEPAPLYGIPVSVDESCAMKGYDITLGLIKYCDNPEVEDSVIVQVLKIEGAIPFLITSIPQAARALSGYNPIFGQIFNPLSICRESGGSGQAVMIAQHGSPIGMSVDYTGDVRVSASFCGLFSLKSTHRRLSTQGIPSIDRYSFYLLRPALTPVGSGVEDLAKLLDTVLRPSMFQLDLTVPPMPFNQTVFRNERMRSVKIGYYDTLMDSHILQTVPAVRHGVRKAVDKLEKLGYSVVEFQPPKVHEAYKLLLRAWLADGGKGLRNVLAHEFVSKDLNTLRIITSIPFGFLAAGANKIISWRLGSMAGFLDHLRGMKGTRELLKLTSDLQKYQDEFSEALVHAGELDILICPVSAYPAPPVGTALWFTVPNLIYSTLYNLLDYPAGTVPVSIVNSAEEKECQRLALECKETNDRFYQRVYDSQTHSDGLPIAVQVIGKQFNEELVLRIMRELEQSLKT
ncbi:unnamed protein product [Calicophoron daubneyi]|uniref:Amidase domain-containing protein n=1 Tax=Calicophoron daubneyi TaxID=300641 RepID=A0AAV2TN75_CALDB